MHNEIETRYSFIKDISMSFTEAFAKDSGISVVNK